MTERVALHDRQAVEAVRRELRLEPQQLRRLRTVFYKKKLGSDAALAQLNEPYREPFEKRVEFYPLKIEQRLDSSADGATKLVFITRSQRRIESVLLRASTGRTSLCLSSQVGCAANCDFCATGKMGFFENLSAAEILDQVVQAAEAVTAEDRQIRNLVFMGMGEPFHNEANLYEAIDALTSGELFNHPASRILVSTVGIPAAMLRCAERFPAVNQAISLHSVDQNVRESIIPLAKKYSVDELRETIVKLNAMQPGSVMIEYLLLAGVNDAPIDAAELARFVEGLRVHVNLIPFNPIEGAPHLVGSQREVREAFATVLKSSGVTTTMRYSMGADIEAACGQLVQQLDRRGRPRG